VTLGIHAQGHRRAGAQAAERELRRVGGRVASTTRDRFVGRELVVAGADVHGERPHLVNSRGLRDQFRTLEGSDDG
jgi:hypothetical protein